MMILFIILGFAIVLLLPPLVMELWWPAKALFMVMSVFMIYSLVRGYLGGGALTIVVSLVLIYFMVFKWFYVFSVLYVFQLLLGLQVFSIIIWGTQRLTMAHG